MNLTNQRQLTDEQLGELLAQCDREVPAPDTAFAERLRETVLDQTRSHPTPVTARRPMWRTVARLVIAAAIAAAVLCALWPRTPSSWAQVREALSSKQWIRLRTKLDDGKTNEFWISIPQQRTAFRFSATARYVDVRGGVQFDYEESRGTVFRAPYRPIQSPESWFVLFQQLMQGRSLDAEEFDHAKVLETRSREVVENGKEWLDIELTMQDIHADPAMRSVKRMEFRVDPETKLPYTMTRAVLVPRPNYPSDGQRRFVTEIDYPPEGPADIYALGIPRDAKLDDGVPPADIVRVLVALSAGRRDFDPYFAIAFEAVGSFEKLYDRMPTCVIWRRGNQVRAEVCWPFESVPPYSEKPANLDDLTWWKQQLKHFRLLPYVVCDGKASYAAVWSPPDEQGNQRVVTAWNPLAVIRKGESLSESHISPARGELPEFFAYPLVESTDSTTVAVELAVTPDMPRGSLLTFRVTGPVTAAYKRTRYWLDGDRGYAATRKSCDEPGIPREKVIKQNLLVEDQYSMRNFQRTPRGFWYSTLVVREYAREPKDPSQERVLEPGVSTSFLLDFNADMPDSLFSKKERRAGL